MLTRILYCFIAFVKLEKNINHKEQDLIYALKEGSHKAFDAIYKIYARRLYAYSLLFTKSHEEAKEVVQDVFIKLWMSRTKIRQEETLRSLLFIIAKNYLINSYRSKINSPVYEEYIMHKETMIVNDTEYQVEYHDFLNKFNKAMEYLPPTQRKIVTLSKIYQFSNKEIVEKLSLSEQTVKNQLSLGLKTLREKLGIAYFFYILFFVN